MKYYVRCLVILGVIAFTFSSCSKKNEVGKMIPKDAMFILQLNTKSLMSKVPWQDVKQTSWFKKASENSGTEQWVTKILDNPENSGIDLDEGLVFFAEKNETAPDGILVLEGSVKNESDFSQFNKNLDSTQSVKTDDGISIEAIKDAGVVGWDGKHFAYVFSAANAKSKLNSMNPMSNQGNMAPLVDQSVALSTACKNLFSLKTDDNMEKNEKFSNLLKETGDMHAWINSEEIMKSSAGLGMMGMLKLDVFFKDNISTYTVNFDNGKVDITHKGYAGDELMSFLKKYKGNGINTDMITTIPSGDIDGIVALSFKPQGIKQLVQMIGLDGMMNSYSGKLGFTLDDFAKANKGDVMISFSDLNLTSQGTGMDSQKPDVNILFSVGIGDKASFQKLLDAGKQLGGTIGTNDTSIAFGQNDKYFAISNHQQFLNEYLAGKSQEKFEFMNTLSGHPIGTFIDIHKILTAFSTNSHLDPDEDSIMDASLRLWKNLYAYSGDIKDDATTGVTEINLMDQNTNSLKQLSQYFDKIATIAMAKISEEKAKESATDSLILTPPPLDTVGHK
jgi:Domain of unknown function (DUF4836)